MSARDCRADLARHVLRYLLAEFAGVPDYAVLDSGHKKEMENGQA